MRQSALTTHFNARKPSNDGVEVLAMRRTSSSGHPSKPASHINNSVSNSSTGEKNMMAAPIAAVARQPLAVIHNNTSGSSNPTNAISMPPPSLPMKSKGPPLITPAPVRPSANLMSWQPRVNAIDLAIRQRVMDEDDDSNFSLTQDVSWQQPQRSISSSPSTSNGGTSNGSSMGRASSWPRTNGEPQVDVMLEQLKRKRKSNPVVEEQEKRRRANLERMSATTQVSRRTMSDPSSRPSGIPVQRLERQRNQMKELMMLAQRLSSQLSPHSTPAPAAIVSSSPSATVHVQSPHHIAAASNVASIIITLPMIAPSPVSSSLTSISTPQHPVAAASRQQQPHMSHAPPPPPPQSSLSSPVVVAHQQPPMVRRASPPLVTAGNATIPVRLPFPSSSSSSSSASASSSSMVPSSSASRVSNQRAPSAPPPPPPQSSSITSVSSRPVANRPIAIANQSSSSRPSPVPAAGVSHTAHSSSNGHRGTRGTAAVAAITAVTGRVVPPPANNGDSILKIVF